MTAVFLLFVIFIIGFSFRNFKKAFFWFVSINIILNPGIAIKYSPPAITVSLLLTLYFIAMFVDRRKKFATGKICFFEKSFVAMSISYIVSMFVAYFDGDSSSITYTVNLVASRFVLYYVLWRLLQNREDIEYIYRCLTWVFGVILVYGVYEYAVGVNPVLGFIESIIPEEFAKNKLYLSDLENLDRGGRPRYQSLFYLTIEYGVACVLYLFFLLQTKHINSLINRKRIVYIAYCVLLMFAIWASNSKTPILAIPICLIPFFVKSIRNMFLTLGCFFLLYILPVDYFSIINNIIDVSSLTGEADNATGSTLEMRLTQLEISINAFMQSPLIGNGNRYCGILARTTDLLGAESCWFKLLIEQGLLGIIAYLSIIVSFVKEGLRKNVNGYILTSFAICFFVMSSVTDIAYGIFFMLFIIISRHQDIENNYDFINSNLPK